MIQTLRIAFIATLLCYTVNAFSQQPPALTDSLARQTAAIFNLKQAQTSVYISCSKVVWFHDIS